MKLKHKIAHMKSAFNYAECSTAVRLKVGCLIVKHDRIISIGYNGMPSGWTNVCEEPVVLEDRGNDSNENQILQPTLKTKPEVIHAEANAVGKLASSHESGLGAAAFITHKPCLSCAKLLYQAGIKEVYYNHEYAYSEGVDFLIKCGIKVEQFDVSMYEFQYMNEDIERRIVQKMYPELEGDDVLLKWTETLKTMYPVQWKIAIDEFWDEYFNPKP